MIAPLTGPTQGGTLVGLRGQNFGLETGKVYLVSGDYNQTRSSSGDAVFIDGRYLRAHTCAVQSWTDNTIVCKTPPGQGKHRRVHVQSKGVDVLSSYREITTANRELLCTTCFTYDPPEILDVPFSAA